MRSVTFRRSAIALAVVVSVCAAACTGDPATVDDPHRRIVAENATTADLLPTDAAALPSFDLERFDDLLNELHGTPVVVNVWGSWCGPCKEEAADLVRAHQRYGDRVQFLGVDVLDARGSAREYQARYRVTYPSVFDPPGAIRDGLGLLGQPVTLFYDATGTLMQTWSGPISTDRLDAAIAEITASA
jgi:cytochrome c biogenesis protein CcmG, thiol:disulfide interchange protein DsbE